MASSTNANRQTFSKKEEKKKKQKQNKANDLFANGIYNRGQRETRRFHDTHCRPTGGAVELIQSSFQRETREDIDTPRSPSDRPPFFSLLDDDDLAQLRLRQQKAQ